MKELSLVFLEKTELQLRRNSVMMAVFGVPSILGPQNDIFQKTYSPSSIAFFDFGETRVVKEIIPEN